VGSCITYPVTQQLRAWQTGDKEAFDELVPFVYDQLRRLALNHLRRERPGHTLKPTGLVHELYLELARSNGITLESRSHFLGVASRLMRQLLVRHARARYAQKRGGRDNPAPLETLDSLPNDISRETLALHEAINALAREDRRKADIVEMRYFGGFTIEEIAAALDISVSTAGREIRTALAWIRLYLGAGEQCTG
jgi:RNA polymerase sigma-70 factor, ECF subfamily